MILPKLYQKLYDCIHALQGGKQATFNINIYMYKIVVSYYCVQQMCALVGVSHITATACTCTYVHYTCRSDLYCMRLG